MAEEPKKEEAKPAEEDKHEAFKKYVMAYLTGLAKHVAYTHAEGGEEKKEEKPEGVRPSFDQEKPKMAENQSSEV